MKKRLKAEGSKEFVFELKPKKVKCRICSKEFEINPNAKFKRKYCEECSKANKSYYDNLDAIKIEDCDD